MVRRYRKLLLALGLHKSLYTLARIRGISHDTLAKRFYRNRRVERAVDALDRAEYAPGLGYSPDELRSINAEAESAVSAVNQILQHLLKPTRNYTPRGMKLVEKKVRESGQPTRR